MKILLFLAKGFETMQASVFIDVFGWTRNDYFLPIEVITCGFSKQLISTIGVPVILDTLINQIIVVS